MSGDRKSRRRWFIQNNRGMTPLHTIWELVLDTPGSAVLAHRSSPHRSQAGSDRGWALDP